MLMAIWLTTFAAVGAPEVLEPADTFVAPQVTEIPEGLRDLAERMPGDGRWVQDKPDGPPPLAGTFLASPLDRHVLRRARLLDRYPSLCQVKIDGARHVHDAEVSAIRQVAQAECIIKRIDDRVSITSDGVPLWAAAIAAVGGLVVGGFIGLAIR